MADLDALAERLDAAAVAAQAIPQLSETEPAPLTLAEAYAVQRRAIDRRVARGHALVGVKMGFTSKAKMEQMGLSEQIWGRLTADMVLPDGGTLPLDRFVHPRVEPEVAFRLRADLRGEISREEAAAAVEAVAPALEIIDSRYADFRFDLADVVADNCSSSAFVVGPWQDPATAYADEPVAVRFDARVVQEGRTAAILGHPLDSLVAAAALLERYGAHLQAGQVVLAGGATAATRLEPGVTVTADVGALGRVGFRVG